MKTTTKTEWTQTVAGRWLNPAIRAEVVPVYTEQSDDSSPWSNATLTGWDVFVDGRAVGSTAHEAKAKFMAAKRWASLPACAKTMGCLCAGHGWRGNPAFKPCDTSER